MYQMLCFAIAALAVVFTGIPSSAPAQVAATEIKLTAKYIEGFIAVQKDISEKTQTGGFSQYADANYKAQLRAITKKRGFKNFAEYEAVAANVSMVLATIDPQTKTFTDPQAAIRKELEDVSADKTIGDREKKKLLTELNAALKAAQSLPHPSNIELVMKYYDKIDMTNIASYDGDRRPTSNAGAHNQRMICQGDA